MQRTNLLRLRRNFNLLRVFFHNYHKCVVGAILLVQSMMHDICICKSSFRNTTRSLDYCSLPCKYNNRSLHLPRYDIHRIFRLTCICIQHHFEVSFSLRNNIRTLSNKSEYRICLYQNNFQVCNGFCSFKIPQ